MNNSKYVKDAHEIVNRATAALEKLDTQEKNVREQLARDELGATGAEAKREEIGQQRRATVAAALSDLDTVHNAFMDALEKSQVIDGSMLHEDAQLLTLPSLELTGTQFSALAEKHKENPLMVQLLQGYQTGHPGLYSDVVIPTPENQKAAFADFLGAAKRAVREPGGMFSAFFTDGKLDPMI